MEAAFVMDQDVEEIETEVVLDEDDLPAGIFPEAHPESCYYELRKHGLSCTRLNAELFYEMDQLRRNRMFGCSTEELREIDLWDPCSGLSVWDEAVFKDNGRLLTPEEAQDNLDRELRWRHVEEFLKQVYQWCLTGRALEIVRHSTRKCRLTWRFRQLRWTEAGIETGDSASQEVPARPSEILNAAWNYLFWCRRRWLMAYPSKVWLSEHCLHLIRHAFKALLDRCEVAEGDRPDIREEDKPSWPSKLEAELGKWEDLERKALTRLDYLQRHRKLTRDKLRTASVYLDEVAEKITSTHRRIDEEVVRLARSCGYDDEYWGTRIEVSYLSPADLLEIKEEMRQVRLADSEPVTESTPKNDDPLLPVGFVPAPASRPHISHEAA